MVLHQFCAIFTERVEVIIVHLAIPVLETAAVFLDQTLILARVRAVQEKEPRFFAIVRQQPLDIARAHVNEFPVFGQ